jgi:hypothetical protein
MSDKSNDTSAIDNKKKGGSLLSDFSSKIKGSLTDFTSNIKGFLIYVITTIILILLYFSSSGLILFVCKLAQTNILPTDENCYPYTNDKVDIEKIKTNIFTPFFDPTLSMKLEIPNDCKNSKYTIINMIKKYKENPNTSFLANYFISIIEPLIQFDYSFINSTMNYVNNLPEYLIILLGPMITTFLFFICLLLNGIYFVYLWFANLGWLFSLNLNTLGLDKPIQSIITIILIPLMLTLSILMIILFIVGLFLGFRFLAAIPVGVLVYCVVSCLLYNGLLNGKPISSLEIIPELFKYYKVSIVSAIVFFVISTAFLKLGIIPGIFLIITFLMIYCGVQDLDIFKPIPETNLSPVVSYKQATRTCQKHGFLYNLLYQTGIFSQKGGNITKELKNISKNLSGK